MTRQRNTVKIKNRCRSLLVICSCTLYIYMPLSNLGFGQGADTLGETAFVGFPDCDLALGVGGQPPRHGGGLLPGRNAPPPLGIPTAAAFGCSVKGPETHRDRRNWGGGACMLALAHPTLLISFLSGHKFWLLHTWLREEENAATASAQTPGRPSRRREKKRGRRDPSASRTSVQFLQGPEPASAFGFCAIKRIRRDGKQTHQSG